MDVRDLNILDWVLWDNTPCQVTAIGCDHIETTRCGITLAESHLLNPIHLTPEILEKNGFELQRDKSELGTLDTYWLGSELGAFRIHNSTYFRFHCIDASGVEYEQPYFTFHPNEFTGKII